MPVSSFRWTGTPSGTWPSATTSSSLALVRAATSLDLSVGPSTTIRVSGNAVPQLERLGHRRDTERRRATLERSPRDVLGAVPVAVRLDDGPELGPVQDVDSRRALRGRAASRA